MSDNLLIDTGKKENLSNVSPLPRTCHIVISTYGNKPIFSSVSNCNKLAYLIFETTVLHKYSLFAFCIMPDHAHILCQPGDILVSQFIGLLRFRFEYVLYKSGYKGLIWLPEFRETPLPDDEVVRAAVFILENPVRSGIVDNALDYPFSFVIEGKGYRPQV